MVQSLSPLRSSAHKGRLWLTAPGNKCHLRRLMVGRFPSVKRCLLAEELADGDERDRAHRAGKKSRWRAC